jgi:hypothetical protein
MASFFQTSRLEVHNFHTTSSFKKKRFDGGLGMQCPDQFESLW